MYCTVFITYINKSGVKIPKPQPSFKKERPGPRRLDVLHVPGVCGMTQEISGPRCADDSRDLWAPKTIGTWSFNQGLPGKFMGFITDF